MRIAFKHANFSRWLLCIIFLMTSSNLLLKHQKMSESCQKRGWWTKYSESRLIEIENNILSVVKTTFRTWFVSIGSTVGIDDKIWTISLNEESKNTPLVMLHGFAAGIGFWCKNFDEIAKDRPVYAIDLLGFGRSSRPTFAKDHAVAEQQYVSTIEEWRKQVNLDKFILLGHSFGGYLAMSYAINHPDRVKHLILADPWGFSDKPADYKPSWRLKVLRTLLYPLVYFNPLATVRAIGPLGPSLVKKLRSDIARRYEDSFENVDIITEYIYQCNSQYPSGESAFHSLVDGFAWSKTPMINRYDQIPENIPITVMYGQHSWIDQMSGLVLQEKRESNGFISIEIIPDAGHHIYSDQPEIFNKSVQDTCKIVDKSQDKEDMLRHLKVYKRHIDRNQVKQFIQMKHDKNDIVNSARLTKAEFRKVTIEDFIEENIEVKEVDEEEEVGETLTQTNK